MPSGARCERQAASTASRTGSRRPRVEPVHDHVVELAELAGRQREHVGDVEAQVAEPRAAAVARAVLDRARREVDADRASTSGLAAAMPARFAPAPQPSSSTRALRGSGGASPCSAATVASTAGRACANGRFA